MNTDKYRFWFSFLFHKALLCSLRFSSLFTSINKQFILFIVLAIPSLVYSQAVIKNVKILSIDTMDYSEVSDLKISKDGKINDISVSKNYKENDVRYAIPSFCDGYVTLGANSAGGQNFEIGIKTALLSFLKHGFTHIQSVGDGPWIRNIQSEILKGKISGPDITISERPIIAKTEEYPNLPIELYFSGKTDDEIWEEFTKQISSESKNIHVYFRFFHDDDFQINSSVLNKMNLLAQEKGKTIIFNPFADKSSILLALSSGISYIEHPIPSSLSKEMSIQHLKSLNWMPLFGVYYLQKLQGNEEKLGEISTKWKAKSDYYKKKYSPVFDSMKGKKELTNEQLLQAEKEFKSYSAFLKKNPTLSEKMLLGSGSGHFLTFPGISGIFELEIINSILKNGYQSLHIPTRNTCRFITDANSSKIEKGENANILLFNSDPLDNFDILYSPLQIFKNGKDVTPR